jgi:hypothetical protein
VFILLVMAVFFTAMHKLQSIEDRIKQNGQVMHEITAQFVVINPGEKWDVKEVGR